jgi:hypothetical protein
MLEQHKLQSAEPTFQTPPDQTARTQAQARQRGIDLPDLGGFITLHFAPDADVRSIAQELRKHPSVKQAAPVPSALPPRSPWNEPLTGTSEQVEIIDSTEGLQNQWYIFRCRANRAWEQTSGSGVVIADIDWGYRTTHEDLAPRLDLGHAYNAYDGGSDVTTGEHVSHGTGVLGLAGAADNDRGMAGYAPEATLWPIQADSGPGAPLGGNPWARAIDWVRTTDSAGKRKVIILEVQTGSYGNYEMDIAVNAAIRTAIADGVVVCVAAGNGDRDAGLDDLGDAIPETGSILVGATAYDASENRRAWFSNYGPRIVVSSPGDGSFDVTCSSSTDQAYTNYFGGTSGATPKVAGTVALMLSLKPDLTHPQIRDILSRTGGLIVTEPGKPVGTFLDADAAVREVVNPTAELRNPSLIQSRFGRRGDFEVVVPLAAGGMVHYRRDNDAGPPPPWHRGAEFGAPAGRVAAVSLIQSNYGTPGNLEVVARVGNRLAHFYRDGGAGAAWSGPYFFATGVDGAPSLVQSRFGRKGNFEVVVPLAAGGLAHYSRNNDAGPPPPWSGPTVFGTGVGRVDAVSLIQSNYGTPGNLEVVARVGSRLAHFYRDGGAGAAWSGPYFFATGVDGAPSLVQSRFGRKGNFEVVVPLAAGGLAHYSRNNDAGSPPPWSGPTVFGTGVGRMDAVSLIQSNYGTPGNLEVVARVGERLVHFWRDSGPRFEWSAPTFIPLL